jgi:hypothetical protein
VVMRNVVMIHYRLPNLAPSTGIHVTAEPRLARFYSCSSVDLRA